MSDPNSNGALGGLALVVMRVGVLTVLTREWTWKGHGIQGTGAESAGYILIGVSLLLLWLFFRARQTPANRRSAPFTPLPPEVLRKSRFLVSRDGGPYVPVDTVSYANLLQDLRSGVTSMLWFADSDLERNLQLRHEHGGLRAYLYTEIGLQVLAIRGPDIPMETMVSDFLSGEPERMTAYDWPSM